MTGGDINNIIAGSFGVERSSTSIGTTEVTISGGLVRSSVLGGSILTYNSDNESNIGFATSNVGSSKITINGDAVIGESVSSAKEKSDNNDVFFNSVYGGGYTAGSGTQTFGSTSVSIAGNAVVNGIVIGGFLAFALSIASGMIMVKIFNLFSKKKINPLIGATGLSAVPMASRVCNEIATKYDVKNHVLNYCMASNISGVIGSAVAAGVLISFLG